MQMKKLLNFYTDKKGEHMNINLENLFMLMKIGQTKKKLKKTLLKN